MSFVTHLFGGGSGSGSQETTVPFAAAAIDVQSSVYGIPIPINIGTMRFAPNMIEYFNFQSYGNYTNSSGGGGKMGGGGGSTGPQLQGYNYYASIAFGLCEGWQYQIIRVWQDQQMYLNGNNAPFWACAEGTIPNYVWNTEAYSGLAYTFEYGMFLGTSPNVPNMNFEVQSFSCGVSWQSSIGLDYGDVWGSLFNSMTQFITTNFEQAMNVVVGNGWATQYVTSYSLDVDPMVGIAKLLTDPYYGVGYPAKYAGSIQLANETITVPVGGGNVIPTYQHSYAFPVNVFDNTTGQMMTMISSGTAAAGQVKVTWNPAIFTFYTFAAADAGHSVNLRYARNMGFEEASRWCNAAQFYVSLYYDSQTACNSMIDDLCNSIRVMPMTSCGYLTFRPIAYSPVGPLNGHVWSPVSQPLFSLTDDDFVSNQGHTASQSGTSSTDPVILTRTRPSDQINNFRLEWLDRQGNQYAPAVYDAKDQANIDMFGLRAPQSYTVHYFCNSGSAGNSALLQIQAQSIRNTYSFSVDERYCVLDIMDVIEVTDTNNPSVTLQWVQISEITENDDGTLSMIASEYPNNANNQPVIAFEPGSGYQLNTFISPGSVNTPVAFAAPIDLATNQGLEMWVAVSGTNTTAWGGCHAYLSTDGTTYKVIGQINFPARVGVTSSVLNAGLDPDTVDSFSVNLSQSGGQLLSGTQNDADQLNTLCLVRGVNGDEYISYETATLIGTNSYTLGTYLRRGQKNTNIVSHPSGSTFVRIDANAIFRVPYTPNQIGQTIYMKFTSFNIYGGAEEDISTVTAYPLVIPEPPLPPDVQNFQVQQFGTAVTFRWDSVSYPLIALTGYYIGYAPKGTTNWGQFTMLTEAQGGDGTEMTNADVPAGSWTFGIRAANISNAQGNTVGLSPDVTTADLTVVNNTSNIANIEQAPDWDGFVQGFVHDGFGLLFPTSINEPELYPPLSAPPTPGLSSVASGLAFAATVFVKITYVTAYGETTPSAEASIAITSGHAVQVASPPANGRATGYNIYLSTSTGTETQQNGTPINIGTAWTQTVLITAQAALPTVNTTGGEGYGDDFVPNPSPIAYYIPPTVDAGLDMQIRIFFSSGSFMGPRMTGTPGTGVTYGVDSWTSSGSDTDVFIPWTVGSVTGRYVRTMLLYSGITDGQVQVFNEFLPSINQVTSEVTSLEEVISAGGTTISFGRTFVTQPFVTATVISGGTALFATVVNITTTQCDVHVWNLSGVDVGGTVILQITGD